MKKTERLTETERVGERLRKTVRQSETLSNTKASQENTRVHRPIAHVGGVTHDPCSLLHLVRIYATKTFQPWQEYVLKYMKTRFNPADNSLPPMNDIFAVRID